jgi:magnesium-transporting ATPase (P-type)
MPKKNKIYWFEGVTEKGVKDLLNDENSKFKWLRPQRNRRILVILMAAGLFLTSLGSYWSTLKTNLNLSEGTSLIVFTVAAIFVIFATLGCYAFLRIAVRSIADAPDELLDERQIAIRNTSFRYAYFILGYILLALMLMVLFGPELQMFQSEGNDGSFIFISIFFACAALPSMVLAWRERDI